MFSWVLLMSDFNARLLLPAVDADKATLRITGKEKYI